MNRNRSESDANHALATRAQRVAAQTTFNRDVLWRAAWRRVQFGEGWDQSIAAAQREAAEHAAAK